MRKAYEIYTHKIYKYWYMHEKYAYMQRKYVQFVSNMFNIDLLTLCELIQKDI